MLITNPILCLINIDICIEKMKLVFNHRYMGNWVNVRRNKTILIEKSIIAQNFSAFKLFLLYIFRTEIKQNIIKLLHLIDNMRMDNEKQEQFRKHLLSFV